MIFTFMIQNIYISYKNIKQATQLFSTLIIIRKIKLEWFLKDHVTMKTGEMNAENSALPSQE